MSKAEKIVRKWRSGGTKDVRWPEVRIVLEAPGFVLRPDSGHHWLAWHAGLAGHPTFGIGRIRINAHYRGRSGQVHPAAVKDILVRSTI